VKTLKYKKQLLFIVVAIVFLLGVAAVSYLYLYTNKDNSPVYKDGYVTFSGEVTNISNECAYDGNCSISVDGSNIVTGSGLSANPTDNIYGRTDNVKIGDRVTLKAVQKSYGLSLQGCSSCYIKKVK